MPSKAKTVILNFENFQEAGRKKEHCVVVLMDFAIALIAILDQINRESFQRFKLRIGKQNIQTQKKSLLI